jgi:protein phosphatase
MFNKIISKLNGKSQVPDPTGGYSIQGRKPTQEDSYFISEKKNGRQLILVADGVGGHGHGDFASKLALEIFENTFAQSDNFGDIQDFLRKTTLVVAAMVLQKSILEPEYTNCGTTLTGFFINENKFYTLNVGDSRCYHYTKDVITRITKDHSLMQDLIDKGELTEEQAMTHPQRNVMTSAIGQALSMLKIDIEGPTEIDFGEMLFAFSDGVHDALTDKQIQTIVDKHKKDNDLAQKLVDASYAAGGKDNITAVYYRHL